MNINQAFESIKILKEKKIEIENIYKDVFSTNLHISLKISSFFTKLIEKEMITFFDLKDIPFPEKNLEEFLENHKSLKELSLIGNESKKIKLMFECEPPKIVPPPEKIKKFSIFSSIPVDTKKILNDIYKGELHKEIIEITKMYRFFFDKKHNIDSKYWIVVSEISDEGDKIQNNRNLLKKKIFDSISNNLNLKMKNEEVKKFINTFSKIKCNQIIKDLDRIQRQNKFNKLNKDKEVIKKGVKRIVKLKNSKKKKNKTNGKFIKNNSEAIQDEEEFSYEIFQK
jgi:hypothetical protein